MTNLPTRRTGEPRLASVASWAVLAASFGLSATTWVALARLAGFTATFTVPGVGVTLAMAWLMPIAVDGYVVVALVLWMAPVPARVATFARKNTYGAAGIGIAAQSAYHLLYTLSTSGEPWRVVLAAIVGALPPAVAGLAVHMRALIRRESSNDADTPGTPPAALPAQTANRPSTTDVAAPATIAGPAPSNESPASLVDVAADPAPVPGTPPVQVPTPAELAARITTARTTTRPAASASGSGRSAHTRPPRPAGPGTTASTLAPSTTDTSVSASDRAQLTPPTVPPDLLAKARRVAAQYRTEHGTPITAGQLALRLKVNSEQAGQALAVLDLAPDSPTEPVPTVNGTRPARAAR
jgi:hypothetical protein